MRLIACAHPGKIGDTLYTLPAIRRLCEIHGAKADLYARWFCEPAKQFIENQPFINKFRMDGIYTECKPRYQGTTKIPEEKNYIKYYDMSWETPPMSPHPENFCELVGVPAWVGKDIRYDVPDGLPGRAVDALQGKTTYAVVVGRGPGAGGFRSLLENVIEMAPWPVLVLGTKDEYIKGGIDLTGLGYLDMARVIARATAFVGMFSSPLVVAQGFEIPKTCVFNGTDWWPHQIVMDGETDYLVMPTAKRVLESATRKLRHKRVW